MRKDVCLETSSDGRYDEGEKCTVYGKPRYLPVGTEIINNFRHYGLNTALIIFPFGFFLMWGKRTEEKKKIS